MPKPTAEIGDIFEIETPAGLAYIQYTHSGGDEGELVRVLPRLYSARPTDFAELAKQRELYFIFYTLEYALRDHQTQFVAHQPIPDSAQAYPLMRWTLSGRSWKILRASDLLTLEFHVRTPAIQTLTPEQEKLSIHQLWPHAVLVREIARGWTPERAHELELEDAATAEEQKKNHRDGDESSRQVMRHYLHFPRKSAAGRAGERLRNLGLRWKFARGRMARIGWRWQGRPLRRVEKVWNNCGTKWRRWLGSSMESMTGGSLGLIRPPGDRIPQRFGTTTVAHL